jgi:N12 class adenine-specific DNA methylase
VSLNAVGKLDLADVAARVKLSQAEDHRSPRPVDLHDAARRMAACRRVPVGRRAPKLEEAEFAARDNKALARNVEALKAVQPDRLGPSQISVKLGASWVNPEYVTEFAKEIERRRGDVRPAHRVVAGAGRRRAQRAPRRRGVRHRRRSPSELLEAALNSRSITIKDQGRQEGSHRQGGDHRRAMAMKKIKDKFKSWVWTDSERAATLVDQYNKRFNNIAPRRSTART